MDKSLSAVFDGWQGYNTSLMRAVEPRTEAELSFRPSTAVQSIAQIANHIAHGRVDWFGRMGAPGSREVADAFTADTAMDGTSLARRLAESWAMVEANLAGWTVADLERTYHQPYMGRVYEVSYQWVVFRILAHDVHHGGQISTLLDLQGIETADLGNNGGHIVEPPVADVL